MGWAADKDTEVSHEVEQRSWVAQGGRIRMQRNYEYKRRYKVE